MLQSGSKYQSRQCVLHIQLKLVNIGKVVKFNSCEILKKMVKFCRSSFTIEVPII